MTMDNDVLDEETTDETLETAEDTTQEAAEAEQTEVKRRWWRRRLIPASRRGRIIAVAILVTLLAAAGGGYYWYRSTQLPDGVALRVSGHDVTIDDLDKEADTLRALYGVTAPTEPAKLDQFRRDLAKAEAVSLILADQVSQHGIVIADKTSQDVLTRYITQQYGNGQSGHDQFVQALGTAGTNEAAVLGEISRQLAISQLFDQVTKDVTVTDDDVKAAFAQRKGSLGTPEKRDISNIVVATKDQADALVTQLQHGADFATLATTTSLDGSTRDSGGQLGQTTADQLDRGYAKVASTAPAGTVFGPVQTNHGWNVGRVNQIVAAVPAVFDQVSANLKQSLQLEKAMNVWRDWLSTQIRNAHVRYADAYRPADPNSAPSTDPGVPQVGSPSTQPSK
jgi:peptidyl-prolyl cis-trans isomerase C